MNNLIELSKLPPWVVDFTNPEVIYDLDQKRFGQHLANLRHSVHVTLEDLGKKMECTPSYISLLEQGKRNWNNPTIIAYLKGIDML